MIKEINKKKKNEWMNVRLYTDLAQRCLEDEEIQKKKIIIQKARAESIITTNGSKTKEKKKCEKKRFISCN